jgi:hypothetical protein
MKPFALFSIALLLGVGIFAYTLFVPADSPTHFTVIMGPETARLERGESVRGVLAVVTLGMTLLAVGIAFWKPRAAAMVWRAVLIVVAIRAFVPAFPVRLLPFASAVFWTGLFIQAILCYSTFRVLRWRHGS